MMFSRATLTLIVGTLALANADNFAVIVAGSSTYANYRHQADACHAYKIAIKNGIPEKNVILFLVDDVANSHENPFKGQCPGNTGHVAGVIKEPSQVSSSTNPPPTESQGLTCTKDANPATQGSRSTAKTSKLC